MNLQQDGDAFTLSICEDAAGRDENRLRRNFRSKTACRQPQARWLASNVVAARRDNNKDSKDKDMLTVSENQDATRACYAYLFEQKAQRILLIRNDMHERSTQSRDVTRRIRRGCVGAHGRTRGVCASRDATRCETRTMIKARCETQIACRETRSSYRNAMKRREKSSGREGLDARRQPRQFARDGLLVQQHPWRRRASARASPS